MRHLGVQHLIAYCVRDACRHQGLIDVSMYPDDVEVRSFASKVVCAKCGGSRTPYRRAAELEGTTTATKPHRQRVALADGRLKHVAKS